MSTQPHPMLSTHCYRKAVHLFNPFKGLLPLSGGLDLETCHVGASAVLNTASIGVLMTLHGNHPFLHVCLPYYSVDSSRTARLS